MKKEFNLTKEKKELGEYEVRITDKDLEELKRNLKEKRKEIN